MDISSAGERWHVSNAQERQRERERENECMVAMKDDRLHSIRDIHA